MEMVVDSGFCEMNQLEMMQFDGGATVGQAVAGTLGIASICWAVPVAVVVGPAGLGAGMAIAGAGAIINMF